MTPRSIIQLTDCLKSLYIKTAQKLKGSDRRQFMAASEPEQMPERFQRVTVEANREASRTALEQGEELHAYFGEREHHLRIK